MLQLCSIFSPGAELMGKFGINVSKGVAVSSVLEVRKAIQTTFPNEKKLVVKSQILAGGRGLGKSTSGLQDGVHIVEAEYPEEIVDVRATEINKVDMHSSFTPMTTLSKFLSLQVARDLSLLSRWMVTDLYTWEAFYEPV